MSEKLILQHCSPTLAGMKTGNMFTCPFDSLTEMNLTLSRFNRLLVKKGLRMLPLKYKNGKALIYLYRPSLLSKDLKHSDADRLLRERGYGMESPEKCIKCLKNRISQSMEFPHEIGLFLGYPPEDVSGFIENKAGGCKYSGFWKVYGDEEAAKKTFAKYKKCTDVYCSLHENGRSIEKLTVSSA